MFDAVCDQIKNLYPTLFAVETKTVTAKVGYIPMSGSTDNYLVAPIKAISQYTDFLQVQMKQELYMLVLQ